MPDGILDLVRRVFPCRNGKDLVQFLERQCYSGSLVPTLLDTFPESGKTYPLSPAQTGEQGTSRRHTTLRTIRTRLAA